jgi:hypothetical protein
MPNPVMTTLRLDKMTPEKEVLEARDQEMLVLM